MIGIYEPERALLLRGLLNYAKGWRTIKSFRLERVALVLKISQKTRLSFDAFNIASLGLRMNS